MGAKTHIIDPQSGRAAKVTDFGQLITAPVAYSSPAQVFMDVQNQAYNLVAPRAGASIVITAIFISANKQVSNTTDATVTLYTASEIDSLTAVANVVNFEIERNGRLVLTSLNALIPPGVYFNAKTTDDDIYVTILYYYLEND